MKSNIKMKIDVDALRLAIPNPELGTDEAISCIQVCKPNKQSFFRVHPDSDFRLQVPLIHMAQERQWYFADQQLWSNLSEELVNFHLMTCIDVFGGIFLWPIKPLDPNRPNSWTQSALEAVDLATSNWVRIIPELAQSKYRIKVAASKLDQPNWPDLSFLEMINKAFEESYISDLDHPVVKRLRGIA